MTEVVFVFDTNALISAHLLSKSVSAVAVVSVSTDIPLFFRNHVSFLPERINENQTSEVKNKLNDLTKQLGPYQGNDLISKRSIGENYILYSFIVKYDRQPIRYLFIYYKQKNTWQLQNFQYDVNLETELIEAANAYRLTENLPGNE